MANLKMDPTEVLPPTSDPIAPQPRADEKVEPGHGDALGTNSNEILTGPNGEEYPTANDLATLRKVKGKIDPLIYTIAFVELIERFAYYGTIIVCE